jgi:probable rRNA maturation factor
MAIVFFNADVKFTLNQKRVFKQFIAKQATKHGVKTVSISYVFCSDEYLLDINRRFLNHDYYTDIITFPLAEEAGKVDAEIYISVDRVKDNAQKLQTAFEDELHRVMFHGVLHLLGLKDKTKAQQQEMRSKEDEWIKAYKKFKP